MSIFPPSPLSHPPSFLLTVVIEHLAGILPAKAVLMLQVTRQSRHSLFAHVDIGSLFRMITEGGSTLYRGSLSQGGSTLGYRKIDWMSGTGD